MVALLLHITIKDARACVLICLQPVVRSVVLHMQAAPDLPPPRKTGPVSPVAEEENIYEDASAPEVPATSVKTPTPDQGLCAKALYDYQESRFIYYGVF